MVFRNFELYIFQKESLEFLGFASVIVMTVFFHVRLGLLERLRRGKGLQILEVVKEIAEG